MSDEGPKSGPIVATLADIDPEPIRWLWPFRIPLGKLTVIGGNPGCAKSLLSLDICSRVSRGLAWPDDPASENPPGSAILINCEDDLSDTVRPRLDAAGADVTKIKAIQGIRTLTPGEDPVDRMFSLAKDVGALRHVIRETPDARVVVIDPLSGFLSGVDSHRDSEMRSVLAPLAEVASEYMVALLAIVHLSKTTTNTSALLRIMGSVGLTGAARAGWLVVKDTDQPRRRKFLPIKCNLAEDLAGLAFSVQESETAPGTACIWWEAGEITQTADEALADGEGPDSTERNEAAAWLRETLADGPVLAKDIKAWAGSAGIAFRTLCRAKTKLGVIPKREGFGKGSKSYWTLPPHIDVAMYNNNGNVWGGGGNVCEPIHCQPSIDCHLNESATPGNVSPDNGDGYPRNWHPRPDPGRFTSR